jgi:hypothetical protein
MKIAVFVYGQYRTFNRVVDTWAFKNDNDFDFYVSMWNKTNNHSKLNVNKVNDRDVTESMVLNHLPPNSKLILLNESNYKIHHTQKKYIHWKNCLEMCVQSNVKYDKILMVRSDGTIKLIGNYTYEDFKKFETEDDYLYGNDSLQLKKFNRILPWIQNDLIFWGNYKTVSKMINQIECSENRMFGDIDDVVDSFLPHVELPMLLIPINILITNQLMFSLNIIRP